MEHEVRNRRKDKIKNAAIIFLVVMLILTLLAPTIMNFSLPQVAVVMPNRSPISEQIRGSTTVEAAATYDVKAEVERKIGAVMVKDGELVAQGQVLFTLSTDDNAAFEELQNAVDALQNEYDKMLLTTGKDYSLDNLAITQQKTELAALNEKKATLPALKAAYDDAVTARKTAEALVNELTKAKADADGIVADFAAENYDFLDEEYVKALEEIQTTITRQETLKLASDQRLKKAEEDLAGSGSPDLSGYRSAVEAARAEVSAREDAILQYQLINPDPAGLASLYEALSAAQAALVIAQANYAEALGKVEDHNRFKSVVVKEQSINDTIVQRIEKYKKQLGEKRIEINKILRERSKKLEDGLDAAKLAVTEAQEAETEAKAEYSVTDEEIDAQILALEYAIQTAELTLAQKQEADAAAAGQSAVDVKAKKDELDRAKKRLEDAQVDAESIDIKAPVAGTITGLSTASGTTPKPGDTLCTIAVLEQGYEASFSVTSDQARRVTVGTTAELENYWYGNEIVVKLARITNDTSDPSKKILTFSLVGDISVGFRVNIVVGEKATDFNAVVPASAVREDNDGKFVLVCVQKSTPIGSRYTAERRAVTIAATNGQITALDGSIDNGEWVITTSTKPISAGVQVRLKD